MYRLHIDIPIGNVSVEEARDWAEDYLNDIEYTFRTGLSDGMEINYRLSNDTDRQKANYLDINENGHASKKKLRLGALEQ